MFNEVGIPRLRGAFVAGAGIHPHADRDRFERRDLLGDQADPIVENTFAVQGNYPPA